MSTVPETLTTAEELQRQLEKHRWIPVTERLPEVPLGDAITSELVLVCATHEYKNVVEISFYNYEIKAWQGEISIPTHWKPIILPETD